MYLGHVNVDSPNRGFPYFSEKTRCSIGANIVGYWCIGESGIGANIVDYWCIGESGEWAE